MDREETTKKLTSVLLRAAVLEPQLKDRFFIRLVREKMGLLIKNYLRWASHDSHSVAQYISQKDLAHSLDSLIDVLRIATRLNLVSDTPLLDAIKSCLDLKLEVTKNKIPGGEVVDVFELKRGKINNSSVVAKKEISSLKQEKNNWRQNENSGRRSNTREMILNFARTQSQAKVKDFVRGLTSVSERTIKRNLSELVREGQLTRRVDNKSVLYSVTE